MGSEYRPAIDLPPLKLGVNISFDPTPFAPPTDKTSSKHILIIGGGIIGLTTAWVLLDRGHKVTIVAEDWPSQVSGQQRLTSQVSGALWEFPPGGCGLTEIEEPDNAHSTLSNYRHWAIETFDVCQQIEDQHPEKATEFGLALKPLVQFFAKDLSTPENSTDVNKRKYDAFKTSAKYRGIDNAVKVSDIKTQTGLTEYLKSLGVDQNYGPGIQSAYEHQAPIIDTDRAMFFLLSLVKGKGAKVETRTICGDLIDKEHQLLADYEADAIVNATGLRSAELAGDKEMYPVRGAVHRVKNKSIGNFQKMDRALLLPAQKDDHGEVNKVVFIVPRNEETLVLGSIIQENNVDLDLSPSSPDMQLIRQRCNEFLSGLEDAQVHENYPITQGLRPFSHLNTRVELENRRESKIVHNYGHGGSGWTLAFGCANSAVDILERILGVK